jgi:myo-inositol 2-dehydrogenase/D-chiro-inositol 1-dehydrogenase
MNTKGDGMSDKQESGKRTSRREFLKTTAVAGTALAANLSVLANVHAAGSDSIKIGLIGCGGRGRGAADNALHAAHHVKLVAMADVFKDHLHASRTKLQDMAAKDERIKELGNSVDVPEDRCFIGFDAFEKVIHSDVDYVILATPPGFRPMMIEAAVAAGKNIFTEKPVGVDGPGIRKVLAAYEQSLKKNLSIAAGTQRRHQAGYLETMKRLHDGAIGTITAGRCYWNQGSLWMKPRQSGWSDMEWQVRNWLYFTWLSGDHICEQHVHNLDVVNWALQHPPVKAVGMGGRQVRVAPEYGHIFDHFAIDYEYPNGIHVMSMCRQIDGCEQSVSEALVGTKGFCQADRYIIKGETNWRRERNKDDVDPYVQEHTDLIESIRSGKPINELKNVAESTLTAIMGRMSAYTGKAVTWDQALNSKQDLMPPKLEWVSLPVPPVAVPGKTKLV